MHTAGELPVLSLLLDLLKNSVIFYELIDDINPKRGEEGEKRKISRKRGHRRREGDD
jgi:hypothetical protein